MNSMNSTFENMDWRLVVSTPAKGVWNMAVDEAFLESILAEDSVPILRLYAWEPPCLSLGYGQGEADVDPERLSARGWDLVRRPTGGKAILHTDELTYSVIGSNRDPRLTGGILASYLTLSGALATAMVKLGLDVDIQPSSKSGSGTISDGPVCFEVPSPYEITSRGRKLIGSAQSRRGDAILQHGAIPLGGDITRITEVLSYPDADSRQDAAKRVLDRATTVERELGKPVLWKAAAEAVTTAFAEDLNLQLLPSALTEKETLRALILMEEKYQIRI
jgi:lipoyl(octanoyl) transferase